jgi:hypothetical protein
VVLAVLACSALFLATGAPASAQQVQDGQRTTALPCEDGGWGVCDTRATDRGYEYRYVGGRFVPKQLGSHPAAKPVNCGDNCPPDPAAVCDLLLALGPPATGSPAEVAAYNDQVATCGVWLADNNAVPVANVQNALADYLRKELLPKASVTAQPNGRSFANLPTLFYAPIPDAFAFNVDQPVLATITAVPHYRWDYGDGEIGPDAPGRPYDPAISPRDHPDVYISHGYARPGAYHVTLTVTWLGSFTVPGVAQVFPLAPVVLVAADDVTVQESVGVLTGND